MSTTPQYDALLSQVTDEFCHKVFAILINHVGEANRIHLDDLTVKTTGKLNPNERRKVRDAIELLRTDYGVCVLSESGIAGRWLAANEGEKEAFLKDTQSRIESMRKVYVAVLRSQVPAVMVEPVEVKQLTCLDFGSY